MLFRRVCDRARLMNGAVRMLRRGIDGIQLNRRPASIDQVVPCSGRDDKGVILAHAGLKIQVVLCLPHVHNTLPCLNANELVQVWMHFQPDIPSDVYAHQGKL